MPPRCKLGFARTPVILTFGLLSPNKGIEVMIDAMPAILEAAVPMPYMLFSERRIPTSCAVKARRTARAWWRACRRSVSGNTLLFLNQFVDQATLLDFISMCDVYVTPYLNEAQMTSGTLAYSFGLGKAVVSTPYWHAQELLAEHRGILVPFADATGNRCRNCGLLTDHARRNAMRKLAYSSSRSMIWARTAERYLEVFEAARRAHPLKVIARRSESILLPDGSTAPPLQLSHFLSMCDDTGLLQHAVCSVPDRGHGYCLDDNARALLVACALNDPGEQRLPETLTSRLAAFVQHAWNPDPQAISQLHEF